MPNMEKLAPRMRPSDLTPERPIHGGPVRAWVAELAEMHLMLELGIVLSPGHMERNHGRGWFRLRPGQVWASGSFEPHQYRVTEPRPMVFRFHFLPSLMNQLPHVKGFDPTAVFRSPARFGPIGSTPAMRKAILALGRELAAKYQKPQPPGPTCVDLQRVLELMSKDVGKPETPPVARRTPFAASRIVPALELLERCPQRVVKAAEAARACHMGLSTFFRKFQQVTRLRFSQFRLRWRLERAAHQLRDSDLPVKTIAQAFGFRDVSHFHRAFVAHYGLTPGRYRRQGP